MYLNLFCSATRLSSNPISSTILFFVIGYPRLSAVINFIVILSNNNFSPSLSWGPNTLNILTELDHIKDLLNGRDYQEYNLSNHDGVTSFLNNILSHFLPSDSQSGDVISIDVKQYNENKNTFDYFYHTANYDATQLFSTGV